MYPFSDFVVLYHDKKIVHYESCSLDTLKNALRTFERMGIVGSAPDDAPPISVGDESDPLRRPYAPKMIQLMPSFLEKGKLQHFVSKINRLRKSSDPRMTGENEAMTAAVLAELPMIGKARL